MSEEFVTAEEAAVRLSLHPRTVRRYIREGRLAARKIGREWRIPLSALRGLLGEDLSPGGSPVLPSGTHGAEDSKGSLRVRVSMVVDVRDADDALRLSRSVLAALNGKGPEYGEVRYDHMYYPNERKARFVVWGDPLFIANLLILFSKISEDPEES